MVAAPKTHYVGNRKGSDAMKKKAPKPVKQPTKPMKKGY